jgi:hypothetical protein
LTAENAQNEEYASGPPENWLILSRTTLPSNEMIKHFFSEQAHVKEFSLALETTQSWHASLNKVRDSASRLLWRLSLSQTNPNFDSTRSFQIG